MKTIKQLLGGDVETSNVRTRPELDIILARLHKFRCPTAPYPIIVYYHPLPACDKAIRRVGVGVVVAVRGG